MSYGINVALAGDSTIPNPPGFPWRGVQGLSELGVEIPITEVKPGNIFISDGSGGVKKEHTGMVMGVVLNPNDPAKLDVWVAEAGGKNGVKDHYGWLVQINVHLQSVLMVRIRVMQDITLYI